MSKRDIYEELTDQIIEDIEKENCLPWEKPWISGFNLPRNADSQKNYNGMNVLLLWIMQRKKGYESGQWLTFKQAKSLGAHVRKGEKSTRIIYYQPLEVQKEKNGKKETETIPLLKTYNVFNICQCEGLEKLLEIELGQVKAKTEIEKLEDAEKLIRASECPIEFNGGTRAYYNYRSDSIHLPKIEFFKSQHGYYSTVFHEMSHSTGHESRLKRDLKNGFGSKDYAFEELIAELGASFLCAHVGLDYSTQHASYIDTWLQALRSDKKFIFNASAQAKKASEYILNLQVKSLELKQVAESVMTLAA